MALVTPKRIKHLSRYFGVLGLLCFVGFWYSAFSYNFLAALGPCFFIVYFVRHYGGPFVSLFPNEAVFNKIFLLFPVTVIYFGLVGLHIKNVLNERGKIRLIVLVAFLGFLSYIHYVAFQELRLYWKASQKSSGFTTPQSTHPSSSLNFPLGNN